MPVMALDWQTDVPAPAGNLEIRKVDVTGDKAGFADAYRVIHESFGGPDIMNDLFVPDDGTVIPYVAYLDGKPVSAAAIWPCRNVFGIYCVSTPEPYRRRGFATELLKRMLQDGRSFAIASLRTTDDLIPLYGGVGFREVGRCLCFRNR